MLQIERGEEGGRPCSELLNGAPPAPRQNNRPANPIKPKTKKYI